MTTEKMKQPVIAQHEDEATPYLNEEVAFTNHKGVYKKGIAKRQQKMFARVDFIKPFLYQGEQIILVTQGCSPISTMEQLMTGWIIVYLKQALFIFTNKRIFHVPAPGFKYKSSIAQILYADCKELKMRFSSLTAKYWNDKKETFRIQGPERKKIKSLLTQIQLEGFHSIEKGRVHICPNCTNELTKGIYTCNTCGLEFKNEKKGRRLSLSFPGGGYFYTRHYFFGISDAFVETALAALLVTSVIDGLKGITEGFIGAFAFGLMLIVEKMITIFHANHFIREYIPAMPVTVENPQKIEQAQETEQEENEYKQLPQPTAMLDFRKH